MNRYVNMRVCLCVCVCLPASACADEYGNKTRFQQLGSRLCYLAHDLIRLRLKRPIMSRKRNRE